MVEKPGWTAWMAMGLALALAGCGASTVALDTGDASPPAALELPLRFEGTAALSSDPTGAATDPAWGAFPLVLELRAGTTPEQLVLMLDPDHAGCALNLARDGATVRFVPGERCATGSPPVLSATQVRSGDATIGPDALSFRVEVAASDEGGPNVLRFSGTRR